MNKANTLKTTLWVAIFLIPSILLSMNPKQRRQFLTKQKRQRQKTPTSVVVPPHIKTKINKVAWTIDDLIKNLKTVQKNITNLAKPSIIFENTVKALKPINTIHKKQQLKPINLQKYKQSLIFKEFTAKLKSAQTQLNNNRQALNNYKQKDYNPEDYKAVDRSYDALIAFFNTVFNGFII